MTYLKNHAEYILLFLFAIIGISTVRSYGYAWDEHAQRVIGEICYNYVFAGNTEYRTFSDRDHGAFFELILIIIEKVGHITTTKGIYTMRHIVTHLFFLVSAFYFFKLIVLLYNNKVLATIGFLLLVINPVIYAHSFFNSKDIPFLSFFIICFYLFAKAFNNKTYWHFILLGLFSGLLISIRIMGIIFMPFVLFFFMLELFKCRSDIKQLKKTLLLSLSYMASTILFTICAWPLLWKNPISNFLYVFDILSKYVWSGTVLFKGEFINSQQLTWDYIPTWFSINNPLIYLVLGFLGILVFCFLTLKNIKKLDLNVLNYSNFLYLFTFFVPVMAIIILHSVVYDGWRHMFYIYPPFIMLAVYFINYSWNKKIKHVVLATAVIAILATSVFIMSNFPLHHIYFNETVSLNKNEYIRKNYEMDYWGVGYKHALKYILKVDKSEIIKIHADTWVCQTNSELLPKYQQRHFMFVDSLQKADYYITTYRWHPNDYTANMKEFKSFMVLDNKVNTIFKVLH
jgi:hypothetical protein